MKKGTLYHSYGQAKNIDIFIKDEGYGDFKFLTLAAKEWAHENGIPNSLAEFGKEFCGMPVWYPGMKKGQYTCGIRQSKIKKFVKAAISAGLNVDCEFDVKL